jgi:hypothetical protein
MTKSPVIASEAVQSRTGTPAFVIHALAHAVAALTAAAEANRAIILLSAPDAGLYTGAGWFAALTAAAHAAIPAARATAMLDCGDDAGAAQSAIRAGIENIIFNGRSDVAARLADIGKQQGARVLTQRPPVLLDLQGAFFADAEILHRRCAAALSDGN